MQRRRLRRYVGVGMVVVGLLQAGVGLTDGSFVYAGLGVTYASLGIVWLRYEV